MPAERAGYTVTMFLIDVSSSMGSICTGGKMTHLEWALQFVKLKVQEMVFNGRKTDQCGVVLFGSEKTRNIINAENGGYENVLEYISITQPNAGTIAKIDALQPSATSGDPIDALIVGIDTQARYLAKKTTWTRKIVILTDGESPIEVEDWEATVDKMDALNISLTIVGIDFDDEELPYTEPNKSTIKRANEIFYTTLTSSMKSGVLGNLDYALGEICRPDIKEVRSALMGTVLCVGDVDTRSDEAFEISVKASKCTALARPKGWKKFALREAATRDTMDMEVDGGDQSEDDDGKTTFVQLRLRTEYYIDRNTGDEEEEEGDVKMKEEDDEENLLDKGENDPEKPKDNNLEKVEKEVLVRGFKYGTTYTPCPDGQFPKLPTRKGIQICGFFLAKNFRRELSMDEIQYIWADPSSPQQQVALSSIVQGMNQKRVMAIARWVSRDGMEPKMGVLSPALFEKVDCLLWSHMPFADDVRKYTFASLDKLVSKKGELITEHPYLPTEEQLNAMDNFVDSMDLMDAGDKDDQDGQHSRRLPWFDTLQSYNPAIHRIKQAMFHCAIVNDIATHPLPPPHPELLKYFEIPEKVLKRARDAVEECTTTFKIKVPKRIRKTRKDGHAHAQDEDDNLLLLDRKKAPEKPFIHVAEASSSSSKAEANAEDSETEDDDEDLLLNKKPSMPLPQLKDVVPLPTPARSLSPQVDPGRAPNMIIGTTYPLKDFKNNIAQGDVVTKAVEDLSVVITEIVMRPFASRRKSELLECMTVLRKTSLEEGEIETWNTFLRNLKEKCLSKPGNFEFWSDVKRIGRDISLISKEEAKRQGCLSSIVDDEAEEFIS